MKISNRDEMVSAVARATEAAAAYYNGGETIMSDEAYDALVEAIEAAADKYPDVDGVDALLNSVAAGVAVVKDVQHKVPMLSLKKVKSTQDVERFVAKVRELGSDVLVELKLDGSALSAHYDNGELVQAVTRGDGTAGKDVTARVRNVVGLPTKLSHPFTGEVRGEVYMTSSQFEATSAARVEAARREFESKKSNANKTFDAASFAFSNSRNAASGLINRDEAPNFDYQLSFAAYDIIADQEDWVLAGENSYRNLSKIVSGFGIATAASLIPELTVDEDGNPRSVAEQVEYIGERRPHLDIPTDGCVIKTDLLSVRKSLGNGSRHPNHSVAYKYEAEEGTTTVRDIEVAVGRTGRISLRARVDSVLVAGTNITYVSLHNPSWVAEMDVRIGSEVKIKRANDVIPQITSVIAQPEDSQPWQAPQTCPQCGQAWNKSSLLWRCESPDCSVLGSVIYSVSRDAMDVDSLGPAVITALVESGKVADTADLFALTEDELATVDMGRKTIDGEPILLGREMARKIHTNLVESRKNQPFARVLVSLGLRATGRGLSRRLAEHFQTVDALLAASVSELAAVDKIGAKKAQVIHAELARRAGLIERLRAQGFNLGSAATADEDAGSKVLAGKNVCVTGSMKGSALDGLSRTETQELIESHGGRAASSVSKTTHILVCAPGVSSSKLTKAQALGTVQIMSPDEFAAMLGL